MVDILIVEDNDELATLLADFLRVSNYSVSIASSGEKAISLFEKYGAKLVLLDIMLPGMDGFEVCSRIRKNSDIPVFVVSAKVSKEDKLSGLILGADDYVEKPYDIDILLAKIDGLFKRRYAKDSIIDGNIAIDIAGNKAFLDDKQLELTIKEFELLKLLVENKGKALRKEYIFNQIWGSDSFSEMQTLTVHIKWLRQKIEVDAKNPVRILTVWGTGYKYE